MAASDQHIANRLRYSLRVSLAFEFYISVFLLYMQQLARFDSVIVCRLIYPSYTCDYPRVSACYCVDELLSIIILLLIWSSQNSSCINLTVVDVWRLCLIICATIADTVSSSHNTFLTYNFKLLWFILCIFILFDFLTGFSFTCGFLFPFLKAPYTPWMRVLPIWTGLITNPTWP